MGGKASRDKGGRSERALVNLLRLSGFTANRIPLSGASEGYKGDVRMIDKGVATVFEVKSRRKEFGRVYAAFEAYQKETGLEKMSLVLGQGVLVSVTPSVHESLQEADTFTFPARTKALEPYSRTLTKILGMRKWLGEAQILAIKDDAKPFLFVRYR